MSTKRLFFQKCKQTTDFFIKFKLDMGHVPISSHDFWDEGINQLVNSVDFAKTMQIFYPFSIQTHPNEFPGESHNDCPRNAKKDQ